MKVYWFFLVLTYKFWSHNQHFWNTQCLSGIGCWFLKCNDFTIIIRQPRTNIKICHLYTWTHFSATLSKALQWRHNEHDGISNHRRLDCLPNRLFICRSKITSKLRVTGLYEGNSTVAVEFPAQRASKAENVSIWWRHHGLRGLVF